MKKERREKVKGEMAGSRPWSAETKRKMVKLHHMQAHMNSFGSFIS
jgi:hypothetical protein